MTPAVVGFAWTHWLADRGVLLDGTDLDYEFAYSLFEAGRHLARIPEGSGTYLWTCGAILKQRQVVEDCFYCPAPETFRLALLEQGPIVLGLNWYGGLDTPEEIEGRAVCRIGDSSVRGGHAVLVNGIALDLELGGTRGFVRFKNSWGRGWGDRGHALLSLEDLDRLLSEDGEAMLAIPAPGLVDDSAPRIDVENWAGRDWQQPDPVVGHYRQESISSDIWTIQDRLGNAAHAEAIARGIRHRGTSPPLTIGIKAQWGAGKTSLMRMIRDLLERPSGDSASPPAELREIHLSDASVAKLTSGAQLSEITNGKLLKLLRKREEPEEKQNLKAHPDRPDDQWRPTVWFNPWTYQTGQQVWAGLAHEIISQTTARMKPVEREHFWLRLNRRRIDEQAVRRRVYALVAGRVVPFAIGAIFLLVAGLALLAAGLRVSGISLTVGSPVVLAGLLSGQAWAVLRSRPCGPLASLTGPAAGLRKTAEGELKDFYSTLVRAPDYAKDAGYFAALQRDLREVLALVATENRPIVVFIDDLDRCSPGTVVQVIEAINTFLSGEFGNAIFVVAMEPRMVAAHVETAYKDLIARVRETAWHSDEGLDLGWKFLDKFIQLPLTLPVMVPDQSSSLLRSLFPIPEDATDRAPEPGPAEPAIRPPTTLDEAVQLADAVPAGSGEATKEAVRAAVDRQLSVDTPGIQAVIDYSARILAPNPRELKRFANVFRFFVMITTERRLLGLPAPGSLDALAKLAVLAVRWPALVPVLASPARGGTVLELLEDPSPGAKGLRSVLVAAGLTTGTIEQLTSPTFRNFLRTPPKIGQDLHGYL
ncbi:P-loop NTPase fold protein [Amycolatopsis sp. NPDC021455]|uniref:P-loop NTPase fold protein n=1 Tax=Amycolatopsis sp. NPDC021455 TaxID=3154901 RepID=UPI0033E5C1A7